MIKKHSLCATLFLGALGFLGSCATVEGTNRQQLMPLPDSYMDSLGLSAYADMKAKDPISKDQVLTHEMQAVAERVAAATGKQLDWEFTLFSSRQVNAFCLPGGKVGVYTGMIPMAKTNAGLAAVLGHEMGHAIAHHSGERMSQQLLLSGALMSVDAIMADSAKKQLTLAALGLGVQVGVTLPFSRLQESEADTLGLIYMARAGYDPHEAIQLWLRMDKVGGALPEFLSTHPDSAKRAAALEQQLAKAMIEYEASSKVATMPLAGG